MAPAVRTADVDQVAAVLRRYPDATIGLLLRAMFEALNTGQPCAPRVEATSVYYFNSDCRELMSRLPSFRAWLARDFFVQEDPAGAGRSPFVKNISSMFDGELRRLRRVGYLASDTKTPPPYQIHLHRAMPHFGFLVVDFADRLEALELNLVTETVVGDFAYGKGILVRADVLPLAWQPARRLDEIPQIAERSTKVALVRLARLLFLAIDDPAQPIDEIFERVFVSSFMHVAVPGTLLGRSTVSAFEKRH